MKMEISNSRIPDDMFLIDDGAYATVTFEKDNNDAIYVDGDFRDEEPEAWDDVSYVHTTKEVAPNARGAVIFSVPFNKPGCGRDTRKSIQDQIWPMMEIAITTMIKNTRGSRK